MPDQPSHASAAPLSPAPSSATRPTDAAGLRQACQLKGAGLALYNLIYWPYLLTSCSALFLPALGLFLGTAWWDPRKRWLQSYTSLWGAHYLSWAPFAGVRVEGREKVLGLDGCILVCNHQSMVDILASFATRLPYLWVSKVENFYVPFLGWNMWLNGYVPLKRGHLPSILRMVRTCLRRLDEGHHLFVFPEGTRSPDGEIRAFHRGAFWLAVKKGVPIVPIVIEGTGTILPKGSFTIRPQPVRVRVLDPIPSDACGSDDRALADHVRSVMNDALTELRAE